MDEFNFQGRQLQLRGPLAGSTHNNALTVPADLITPGGPQPAPSTGSFVWTPRGPLELLIPIVTGADNSTASYRVYAWRSITRPESGAEPRDRQWMSIPIGQFVAQACTKTGVAGGLVDTNWRYCDVLTLTERGISPPGMRALQVAGGDNEPAAIVIDTVDVGVLEVRGTLNGGTATAFNVLSCSLGGC